jgi:hypothetical protein
MGAGNMEMNQAFGTGEGRCQPARLESETAALTGLHCAARGHPRAGFRWRVGSHRKL